MPQSTLLLLLLLLLVFLLLRSLLDGSSSTAGPIVDKSWRRARRFSSRLLHLLLFDLLTLLGGHWLTLAELLEESLLLHGVVLLLQILALLYLFLLLLS